LPVAEVGGAVRLDLVCFLQQAIVQSR
jgi:hypothetical protein